MKPIDTKKKVQLQGRNSIEMQAANLDEGSAHNLDRIHYLIEQMLNEKASNSVIIRRAIEIYRLHFIEGMYHSYTKGRTKAQKAENFAAFCEVERMKLKEVAEGSNL
jgi:hypothetical protein